MSLPREPKASFNRPANHTPPLRPPTQMCPWLVNCLAVVYIVVRLNLHQQRHCANAQAVMQAASDSSVPARSPTPQWGPRPSQAAAVGLTPFQVEAPGLGATPGAGRVPLARQQDAKPASWLQGVYKVTGVKLLR